MPTQAELPPSVRWLVFVTAGLLLFWAAIASVSRGIADFYYYPAKVSFRTWGQDQRPVTGNEYRLMQDMVSQALKWDAKNPLLIEARGRVNDGLSQLLPDEASKDEKLKMALSDFRRAAVLMPSSPWVWRNIALMKARLGEYDSNLEQYLLHAHALAPDRLNIHYTMVEIGLAGWGVFTPPARGRVIASMRTLLEYRGAEKFLVDVAERYRKKQVVCSNFQQHSRMQKYCVGT